jgi:hypothetical protein
MIPASAPILHGRDAADRWIVLDADSHEEAFSKVTKIIFPGDNRPISGKSYVSKWALKPGSYSLNDGKAPLDALPKFRVNDRVILHRPYRAGWTENGQGFRRGAISEVVSPTYFAIALDGYDNPHVDFTLREFAPEGVV